MSLSLLATLVVILGGADDRPFQQPKSLPRVEVPATRAIAPPAKKRLFANLFQPPMMPDANVDGSAGLARNQRIICGLTVWQMTSEIDPRVHVSLPDRGREPKVRRIVPQTCRE
jgi:hypothetical protein